MKPLSAQFTVAARIYASLHVVIFITMVVTTALADTALSFSQMGSSIPGNMANGYSGCGVSYSGATTRVAIRGYGFNSSGLVTVYEWESDSSSWSQMGSGIEFPDNGSYTSCPVSISKDGTRLAIGTWNNNYIRMYEWNSVSSSWSQMGSDITGAGTSVSISSDGLRVAIGASTFSPMNVRVYEWNSGSSSWSQMGSNINDVGDQVSITNTGVRVAIGTPNSDIVCVYEWNLVSTSWSQMGSDIVGEIGVSFGTSVSISSEGMHLAIGTGYGTGAVLVYEWNSVSSSWSQMGSDIVGEIGDSFGTSVSISGDGMHLAIGAYGKDLVRIYEWNPTSTRWLQTGSDILGGGGSQSFGYAVSISSSGLHVAIGAFYEGYGTTRVYFTSCSENYYVFSDVCTPCSSGTTNPAGDDVSGSDTICSKCAANFRVSQNLCKPCPVGTTNVDGDDFSGPDTSCDVVYCSENEFVSSNVCTTCPPNSVNTAGDDASGADTNCGCIENSFVLSNTCTTCPPNSVNTAGDDASGADTNCGCIENYFVLSNTCKFCGFGYSNQAGDNPFGQNTECVIGDSEIDSSSSSSINTTLIGAAIGAISLPAIILAVMKVFASKVLRAFLLKFGGCGRWFADLIVPNTQGDVKKINVKMKDVEAFMLKQKLPRLVNTTPSLDESLIIVEKSKPLGRGGFGVVFKGNMLRSSAKQTQRVAVKCLFNPTRDPMKAIVPEDIEKQMNREATILCSLNHPNIIRIFGVVLNRGWIIMELCARGSLRSILLDKDNALETPELVRFASETATGVAYLHATDVSIIHGDLKADNVLVREDGSICLCDFGMSEAKDRSKSMTTAVGVSSGSGSGGLTVQWSSPELLKGKRKDRASDVFALAVTLWEIFERDTPFGGMADMIVINQILAGIRPEFENTPLEFHAVVGKAWGDDAKSRPSAAQMACVLSN